MKRWLFSISLLNLFLLAGCGNNTIDENKNVDIENETGAVEIAEKDNVASIEDIIVDYLTTNYSCGDESKLFVNYAELGEKSLDGGMLELYINVNAEGFYIDERGNLNDDCGYSAPTKITLSSENGIYSIIDSVRPRDGSDYDESLKEMFPEEIINKLYKGNYEFIDNKTLLEKAEEYFGVTIIPEEENNFECKFCDKLWYYEPYDDMDLKTNDLIFNYVSMDNGNNTIYFGSDGTFEAKGKWDEGQGTRAFGQDENTIIVLNNNLDHVYNRYIITNQTEDSLSTILEIIQRR